MARELIRLGYLRQATENFSVLELTQQGQAFTQERHTIMLTKPISEPARKAKPTDEQAHDESLFDRLRQLRKTLADERDVPAYVIFSDVALRQMAQDYPSNEQEFLRISGVGSRKLEEFGAAFLGTIADYLESNPRQKFLKHIHRPNTIGTHTREAKTSERDDQRNTTLISKRIFGRPHRQTTKTGWKYNLWTSRTSDPSRRTSRYQSSLNT